jgi:hypothetical protein
MVVSQLVYDKLDMQYRKSQDEITNLKLLLRTYKEEKKELIKCMEQIKEDIKGKRNLKRQIAICI